MMMTGEQYRESLRDGRKVYCQGERIDDVTTHPLTKLAVDWIVRGYDEHYDPNAECGPYFTIPRPSRSCVTPRSSRRTGTSRRSRRRAGC